MPSLLYFLDTVEGKVDLGKLEALGLGHLADTPQEAGRLVCARVKSGPDGNPGMLMQMPWKTQEGGSDHRCTYDAAGQTWVNCRPTEGTGRLWVGYAGDPPTPADLRRDAGNQVPGDRVRMADSQEYEIPKVREIAGGPEGSGTRCMLPRRLWRGGDGRWDSAKLSQEHEELWERSAAVFDLFASGDLNDDGVEVEVDSLFDHVAELLSVNYRLGWDELNALGLITPESAGEAARSSCDFDAVVKRIEQQMAGQKKTVDGENLDSEPPGDAG